MKFNSKSILTVFSCVLFSVCSIAQTSATNPGLTPEQWRQDLNYFKNLVHTKYQNLFHNVTVQQFNDAVAAIDKKIGTLSDVQMNLEFVKLVAMFRIGHTAVRQRLSSTDQAR